jgi:hypothetical protein
MDTVRNQSAADYKSALRANGVDEKYVEQLWLAERSRRIQVICDRYGIDREVLRS